MLVELIAGITTLKRRGNEFRITDKDARVSSPELPRVTSRGLRIFFQLGGKTWLKWYRFTRSIEEAIF